MNSSVDVGASCVPQAGVPALRSARAVTVAVAAEEISVLEVAEAALTRIAEVNPLVNAFTTVTAERARRSAEAIDTMRARGLALPTLAGVPYAVKNLFDIAGLSTVAGSRVLARTPAAASDAVLIQRMDAAGAILVGALNMDEFAYGFTTENSHYGATRNPHALTHSAGGSSGGCAAAVAAGMVPLSLGSDTNGSIRVPASLCGVYGLKPTFGRLPRQGSYPFVHSLDHLGPFARNASDLAAVYAALLGTGATGLTSGTHPVDRPLRVALLGGYFQEFAASRAREAARGAAAALGADEEVTFALARQARAAAYLITAAEGGQLHLAHLRTVYHDMEPLSRDRLAAGAMLPAHAYIQAQRVRAAARAEAIGLFERFDVLVAPATPVSAQPLDSDFFEIDGRDWPTRPNMGLLTQPISCVGLPVATVPWPAPPGALPLGVQLIAAPGREHIALDAASLLEQAIGRHSAGGSS